MAIEETVRATRGTVMATANCEDNPWNSHGKR